jgi:hypothetical protein
VVAFGHNLLTPQLPKDARAHGVEYFTIPGADLRMFRCADHDATVSTRGCASRHLAAQTERRRSDPDAPTTSACARCPIGAAHAGRPIVHYSRDFASDRCPRCATGTTRMIHNRVCVSCYNREREVRAGRNGRGHAPRELASVVTIHAAYTVDGQLRPAEARTVAVPHKARVRIGREKGRPGKPGKPVYAEFDRGGAAELVLQTLRTVRGEVDFHPITERPAVALQREFAW